MDKFKSVARSMLPDLAPGLVFFIANHYWGLKVAVLSSLAFLTVDLTRKVYRREKPSAIYIYAAVITVVFGGIDLYLKRALFFRYEASLTNLLTAVFFATTLRDGRSIIQDFAEKAMQAEGKAMTPDHIYYFRMLTIVWISYFIAKASVYTYLAASPISFEHLLIVRAVIGNVSLYALLAASIFGSKPIFSFLRGSRLLPSTRVQTLEGLPMP